MLLLCAAAAHVVPARAAAVPPLLPPGLAEVIQDVTGAVSGAVSKLFEDEELVNSLVDMAKQKGKDFVKARLREMLGVYGAPALHSKGAVPPLIPGLGDVVRDAKDIINKVLEDEEFVQDLVDIVKAGGRRMLEEKLRDMLGVYSSPAGAQYDVKE